MRAFHHAPPTTPRRDPASPPAPGPAAGASSTVAFRLATATPVIARSDPAEREADAAAERVTRAAGDAPAPEAALHADAAPGCGSGGAPLPPAVRAEMEPRFGVRLGGVRVHQGPAAAGAARAIGARAFTLGRDIVFGAGELAPETADGKRLIAHELAHVVQQSPSVSASPASPAAPRLGRYPARVSRTPTDGTATMHEALIEQWRAEHGLPPHGIDPLSGQRVGPTDSEIRFGGLLDAWLLSRGSGAAGTPGTAGTTGTAGTPGTAGTAGSPGTAGTAGTPTTAPATVPTIAAPATAPSLAAPGTTNVVATCGTGATMPQCRTHKTYVLNILPQAIANIAAVRSPYNAAISALFSATLPAAQAAQPPTPNGASASAPAAGPVTVTFGRSSHTFANFTLSLQQRPGGANGFALGIGGPTAFIEMNESSNDAALRNLAGIEDTMVHETMHILMAVVEADNAAARLAGGPVSDANLDRVEYAATATSLEAAVLPFVNQIRALPSFTGQPAQATPASNARVTSQTFLSEMIARTEAGIHAKQRAGQAFAPADLTPLLPFIRTAAYWNPTPPVQSELESFLTANQAQIDAAIGPLVRRAGERYLTLRP